MRGAALLLVLASAGVSSAQARCDEAGAGLALPLDGTPIVVDAETIELRGTVDSTRDGSVLDAFARRSDGRTFVEEGPFVALPPGSVLVHEDLDAHAYRVALPGPGPHRVAFALGRVGATQLLTRGEALAGLRGRIELCALRAAEAPVAVVGDVVVEAADGSDEVSASAGAPAFAWLLLGVVGLALGGVVHRARRRRDEGWPRLERRAARAVRSAEREVSRLGPAFEPVAAQAREVHELFERVRLHASELSRASARIAGEGREAAARRQALRAEEAAVLARAEGLVERLEGTAASLAAELAEQHRVRDVEARVEGLGRELELAVAADREARASS